MTDEIREFMEKRRRKAARYSEDRQADKLISHWAGRDFFRGEVVDTRVAVLNTEGCAWAREGGCTMCGYFNDTRRGKGVSDKDFEGQFEEIRKIYAGEPYVKIFVSGSFFNNEEVPADIAVKILKYLTERCDKICVESRPEYVDEKWLDRLSSLPARTEIALGLETSDDELRERVVNKNITFEQFKRAAMMIREKGSEVKTYLLLKPPFLTEKGAIEDGIRSIRDAVPYSDTISVNPVNVQKYTLVDYLHYKGHYRTPWYHSLIEVFRRCWAFAEKRGVRLMSAPTGGGTERGIHNCGRCDDRYAAAIEQLSLRKAGPEVIEDLRCSCRIKWKCDLDTQGASLDHISTG